MAVGAMFAERGLTGAACAAAVDGGPAVGVNADLLVTPASVMKIQIALAVHNAIEAGSVDGAARRVLRPERRTPGPVGMSLMRDEVTMSVRDLVVAMLTISDNVATDELLAIIGTDQVNRTTRDLGLGQTLITSPLQEMLDSMSLEAGFADFAALTAHDPGRAGPPSDEEITARIARSAALDPTRGSRTTAAETTALLQAIWTDRAGPPHACAAVRRAMGQQLTRHRIASGFGPEAAVFAKSGALMGVVRNEAGVVVYPDGRAYAIAVFTRREPGHSCDPARIDSAIGTIARNLVDQLRTNLP